MINSLKRHQFFTLTSGIVAANLIGLLTMPFLTRLYPVKAFGYFAIYSAISFIAGMFSTLRFEQALPLVKDDQEASRLNSLALGLTAILSALFASVIFLTPFAAIFKAAPQDPGFWIATAISVPLIGIAFTQTYAHVRLGTLSQISWRQFLERVAVLGFSVAFAYTDFKELGLVWAQAAGYAVSVLVLAPRSRIDIKAIWKLQRVDYAKTFSAYSDFPLKNGASSIFQLVTSQVPPVIFSIFYPAQMLGFLGLAQRIVDMPNTIFMSSGATIYYRRLANADRSEFRRLFGLGMKLALPALALPFLLAGLTAPLWITRIFGDQWTLAAPFFLLLCPAGCLRIIYTIQANVLVVLRRLDLDMKISATVMGCQLLGIAIGSWINPDLLWPVAIGSALTSLAYIGGLILIGRKARAP